MGLCLGVGTLVLGPWGMWIDRQRAYWGVVITVLGFTYFTGAFSIWRHKGEEIRELSKDL